MEKRLFTRNFTLLILGQAASLTGNFTLKFALSMYVLEKTGSAAVFAGMLAAAMLPTVLLSPLGGVLADRVNRRSIMVALDALSGLAIWITGAALSAGDELLIIGALLVALSILGAFESPTVQACIPQILAGDQLVQGNAMVAQVAAVASLVTPFLGSICYTAWGILPVLYGAAVCFFVTALLECLIRIRAPSAANAGQSGAVTQDLRMSVRFLCWEQRAVLKLLLLAALVSLFVAGTVVVGFPYLVRTVLNLSAWHYGVAESAMGVAAILGSLCVGQLGQKLRMGRLAIVFFSFGVCLVGAGIAFMLPAGALARYAVLLALFCVCQFGCSVFSTCVISIIQRRTPEHMMGRVMAYVFTLSMCAQPVGQIAYGALFDLLSGSVYAVLVPSGLLVCIIGLASRRFFVEMEGETTETL